MGITSPPASSCSSALIVLAATAAPANGQTVTSYIAEVCNAGTNVQTMR